jgi:hypothetical protein
LGVGRTADQCARTRCRAFNEREQIDEIPTAQMTVSELIEQLRAMPPDASVTIWNRMDDPQQWNIESVELATAKSDPSAEIVVLS